MLSRYAPLIGLGLVGAAVAVPGVNAVQHNQQQDVGKMFDSSCASCHVRPDARFKTDKAWINRIAGTT